MNFIKVISTVLLILLLVFASVNAFIPASFKVERYVELELSEKQLYNYVRDLNHFKSWNPWFNLENAVTELQGQIGDERLSLNDK